MSFKRLGSIFVASSLIILILSATNAISRAEFDIGDIYLSNPVKASVTNVPCARYAMHDINKMGLAISNQGIFGSGFANLGSDDLGVPLRSATYPYPGNTEYLFAGSFWIGSIVGRDTLVSVGVDGWGYTQEMWPPACGYPQNGEIRRLSISNAEDIIAGALSEQDFIALYADTLTDPSYVINDPHDGLPHQPLNIAVTQRSMGWSYSYAEDFILFDYAIKNIGRQELEKVYMGIYVDGDVGVVSAPNSEAQDDICGFKRWIPSPMANVDPACGFIDTINIAWISDNDGRPNTGNLPSCPASFDFTSVTGTRVVRTPSDSLKYSFNWWISNTTASKDFGPRKAHSSNDPFRDFGGFLGTPMGDRNKYYIMRHEEFDYDQLFSAVDQTSDGWLPPSSDGDDFANGYDTRYLLSFGPFDISPGEVLRLSLAYIGGQNFLTDCEAFGNLWNSQNPQRYYDYLNFHDLGLNSVWASWIYDNPNRDTNGNKYFGKFRVCCKDTSEVITVISEDPFVTETTMVCIKADTMWYEGDGVPDFEGARPPVAPKMWIYPRVNAFNEGELVVRFNGFESETVPDNFSGELDFEGYRVWCALSFNPDAFSRQASYDIEDYNRMEYDSNNEIWTIRRIPYTLEELHDLYGANFNPKIHTRDNLYYDQNEGQYFWFAPQDWNQCELNDTNLIHKRFPDEPPPTILDLDSAEIYYPEELTDDGYFRYYEYEYTLRKLLPSQMYYVAVTAFDYGSPISGLPSLETAISRNYLAAYAQSTNSEVQRRGLDVVVYPNPYRVNGNYQVIEGGGFEGRDADPSLPTDRKRAIHFSNLPHKCTIRIFTIDGDLVRQIDHDMPMDSPTSMHDSWDLITRNTQAVVSGIYYYSVESEYGNQIGKLVIIM